MHKTDDSADLGSAIQAIDDANLDDPNQSDGAPLAFRQGVLAQGWVERLEPNASVALRLAARAHHLRRWEIPRSTYSDGRSGYLRWRRDQMKRHAGQLRSIIIDARLGSDVADRAGLIVSKTALGSDPEVQVFEDAVVLTFLQTQLAITAANLLDDDRMVDIIGKSLTKMSVAGRRAAATIELTPELADLVDRAMLSPQSPLSPHEQTTDGLDST